jgi:hypothetical protein
MVVRAIGVAFAVAGWVYGQKKGYSLFGKSLCGLVAVWIFILVAAFLSAFFLPES